MQRDREEVREQHGRLAEGLSRQNGEHPASRVLSRGNGEQGLPGGLRWAVKTTDTPEDQDIAKRRGLTSYEESINLKSPVILKKLEIRFIT